MTDHQLLHLTSPNGRIPRYIMPAVVKLANDMESCFKVCLQDLSSVTGSILITKTHHLLSFILTCRLHVPIVPSNAVSVEVYVSKDIY